MDSIESSSEWLDTPQMLTCRLHACAQLLKLLFVAFASHHAAFVSFCGIVCLAQVLKSLEQCCIFGVFFLL
jgi:hypothetical protein